MNFFELLVKFALDKHKKTRKALEALIVMVLNLRKAGFNIDFDPILKIMQRMRNEKRTKLSRK